MGTGLEFINDEDTQGIIPRAIDEIFHSLSTRTRDNPNGFKYSLHITFIELYNEELLDLLNPRPRSANNSGSGWGGLTIREDTKGNIIWGGIREQTVSSPEDVLG
jgi:Kinesin motor domain